MAYILLLLINIKREFNVELEAVRVCHSRRVLPGVSVALVDDVFDLYKPKT